jgi:hypothetical protein
VILTLRAEFETAPLKSDNNRTKEATNVDMILSALTVAMVVQA